MSCVYPVPEETRSASQIIARAREAKWAMWNPKGKVCKPVPQVRTVPVPRTAPIVKAPLPSIVRNIFKEAIEVERCWMVEAHALLAMAELPKHTFSEVFAAVRDAAGVSHNDMLSTLRARKVAKARQIFFFVARKLTNRSLPQIGMYVGGKDHTTVLHGVRVIEQALLEGDVWISQVVAAATKKLEARQK